MSKLTDQENATYERVYKEEIAKTNGDAKSVGRCHDLAMAAAKVNRHHE